MRFLYDEPRAIALLLIVVPYFAELSEALPEENLNVFNVPANYPPRVPLAPTAFSVEAESEEGRAAG